MSMNKAELLQKLNDGWREFQDYLDSLSQADFTANSDLAGWTVKDHLAHIVVWEDGIWALLEGGSRHQQMGLDRETFHSGDYDHINEVLRQNDIDTPLEDIRQRFREVHERLVAKIDTLSDEDLYLPYKHYQPESTADRPVINWIGGNTYEHYAEHTPWIEKIVAGEK
jgi:uncharacterized protein (TIGR03083 family)